MAYQLKKVSEIIMDFGLQEFGEGHNYFAECCKFRMQKYTPNSKGDGGEWSTLNDPRIDAQCNLWYETSYAGYQYYGKRKDGTHKVENYTTPGTGPYWDKQMLSVEKDDLVKDMQEWIKKRGNK